MAEILSLPIAAEELIPHRLPMRLVETLVSSSEGVGIVEATVLPDSPLITSDGRLESVGLVEMLAQSFAAMKGFEDRRKGEPVRRGFLVGLRSLRLNGVARAGDSLEIRVRTTAEMDGFALAEGEVWRNAELLAVGTLKLWVSPEAAEEVPCAS